MEAEGLEDEERWRIMGVVRGREGGRQERISVKNGMKLKKVLCSTKS